MNWKATAAAAMATCVMQVHAADMTAYGLEFGKPLDLVECAFKMLAGTKFYLAATQPCLQHKNSPGPVTGATAGATIHFPSSQAPRHAAYGSITPKVIAGVLQGVVVHTAGAAVQNQILSDLVAKYGNPTSQSAQALINAVGAQIPSIIATWARADLRVEFIGVTGQVDSGLLLIGTPAGVESYHAGMREYQMKYGGAKL